MVLRPLPMKSSDFTICPSWSMTSKDGILSPIFSIVLGYYGSVFVEEEEGERCPVGAGHDGGGVHRCTDGGAAGEDGCKEQAGVVGRQGRPEFAGQGEAVDGFGGGPGQNGHPHRHDTTPPHPVKHRPPDPQPPSPIPN